MNENVVLMDLLFKMVFLLNLNIHKKCCINNIEKLINSYYKN
jgi:hypothetical protein